MTVWPHDCALPPPARRVDGPRTGCRIKGHDEQDGGRRHHGAATEQGDVHSHGACRATHGSQANMLPEQRVWSRCRLCAQRRVVSVHCACPGSKTPPGEVCNLAQSASEKQAALSESCESSIAGDWRIEDSERDAGALLRHGPHAGKLLLEHRSSLPGGHGDLASEAPLSTPVCVSVHTQHALPEATTQQRQEQLAPLAAGPARQAPQEQRAACSRRAGIGWQRSQLSLQVLRCCHKARHVDNSAEQHRPKARLHVRRHNVLQR